MSEFFAIDKERVRERLAERGIVNEKLVDPHKLANDPFIKQVEADAERLAAEQDVSYERFSVIETDKGYAIWDDLHDGYYVDEEGVTEEFPGEWQAESYLEEIRKAVQAKEAAEWDYIERAKVEPSEPQTIVAPASDAPALPYSVGDTLYLEEGKPFIIEQIGSLNVRLRDPSLRYPIHYLLLLVGVPRLCVAPFFLLRNGGKEHGYYPHHPHAPNQRQNRRPMLIRSHGLR